MISTCYAISRAWHARCYVAGMTHLRFHKIGLATALLAAACSSAPAPGSSGRNGAEPSGPVARDAGEAFPDRPADVPAITPAQIASACAESAACIPDRGQYTKNDLYGLIALCVEDARWSAERAVPMSDLSNDNERAEYYVTCVLDHAGDCNAVNACRTDRDPSITCQEDGCAGPASTTVSCDGTVAHITIDGTTTERDCARAYADCDPSSPTGCTDRHYTACPADGDHADHCDGDVRLGCDGLGQVSYHDCARLGGHCGDTGGGAQGCIYPGTADPGCSGDTPAMPACSGDQIAVCLNGRRVTAPAAALCNAAP